MVNEESVSLRPMKLQARPHPALPPDRTDLDPEDWAAERAQAHRMLDDVLDHLQGLAEGPVWRPMDDRARSAFRTRLPWAGQGIAAAHADFMDQVLPYATGNGHPRFMGWVHGGGNLAGVLAARTAALGAGCRIDGVAEAGAGLTAYASEGAHSCIAKALDIAGLGSAALRKIAVQGDGGVDTRALAEAVAADRAAGLDPFLIVGTAGSVDTGAVDDLAALADVAARERLWLHVDGAFGALAALAPELKPLLTGVERADSIAFDFHKWGQAPYDAGFILMRDAERHRAAFASAAPYLQRRPRGLAAGEPWPCDFGPDLSRGFRALKVWFAFKAYGAAAMGDAIAATCHAARALGARIDAEPELERLAPVTLNIACFRYRGSDALNAEIVVRLQEAGLFAPSTTTLGGRLCIRAAIVNHRTTNEDALALADQVLWLGRALAASGEFA